MLRAIFFDFNGILVDDESLHLELFQRVLSEEGISISEDEYYKTYVGYDDNGCFSEVFRRAGRELDPTLLVRLVARKSSYYNERIHHDGFSFFPGAIELVKEASGSSVALAIVSGALRQEIEDALDQESLRPFFKIIVAAEDVRTGKPDPEGYNKAIQGLNSLRPLPERLFHPHEILAIEDTPPGLEAAAATGLVTLAVGHTFAASALQIADVLTDDLVGMTVDRLQREFAEASAR